MCAHRAVSNGNTKTFVVTEPSAPDKNSASTSAISQSLLRARTDGCQLVVVGAVVVSGGLLLLLPRA